MREIRFAIRRLWKSPLQLAVGILAFTLGIGVNTAMFSIADALLFHPFDVDKLDRLAIFDSSARGVQQGIDDMTPGDYYEFRASLKSFSALALSTYWDATITRDAEPEQVRAAQVSDNWLDTLGSKMIRGRAFASGEGQSGKNRVIVIGEGLWTRRYAGDPKIIGRKLILNNAEFEVIGVVSHTSRYPAYVQIFTPIARTPQLEQQRDRFDYTIVGRLAPGATFRTAEAELATVQAGLVSRNPKTHTGRSVQVAPLTDRATGSTDLLARYMRMLIFAAGAVLLIACANVANLQLARVSGRTREFAILTALGAGRWAIARQVLIESLILAGSGAVVGAFAAVWSVDLLKNTLPAEIWQYVPMWPSIHVNLYALLCTASAAILAGVLAGLGPAFQSSQSDPQDALREGSRTMSTGARRQWFRGALVAFQMTLALVLLIGAGLMVRGTQSYFNRLENKQPTQIATMQALLPVTKYDTPAKRIEFARNLETELRSIPGATEFALVNDIPLSDNGNSNFVVIEGRPDPPVADRQRALNLVVSSGYFHLMKVPLLRGRFLEAGDQAGRESVCLIDETFAKSFFPTEDPIGHRVSPTFDTTRNYCRIVGVVGAELHFAWEAGPRKTFYRPVAQVGPRSVSLLVRASGPVNPVLLAAKLAVFAVDSDQPVRQAFVYRQLIENTLAGLRMVALLMSGIGLVALVLACLGIYSVLSYTVSERTSEIGMRMAMGAQSSDVLLLIGKQACVMCGSGMLLGLGLGYVLAQLFSGLVFGVTSSDFWSLSSVSLLLGAVAALAMYIPARRAIQMDPANALRHD